MKVLPLIHLKNIPGIDIVRGVELDIKRSAFDLKASIVLFRQNAKKIKLLYKSLDN